jgi:hypothetical protein
VGIRASRVQYALCDCIRTLRLHAQSHVLLAAQGTGAFCIPSCMWSTAQCPRHSTLHAWMHVPPPCFASGLTTRWLLAAQGMGGQVRPSARGLQRLHLL